ncbi:lactamase [Macrolepiota fuliginosa MF-IS2]|uniref:Lactamase n=1 Tax=Macrolepiota fuliginosa MF-IS2 TaxID=1400762 RepID=A0A9P5XNI1_9AGAR|nr:lactamase [Macrolepiota fuliginosa MF-IS2]
MVEKLEDLPSISRISDNVVRVLGQNPGKFTLQGTNTYILGTQAPYILLDTSEGKPDYIPVLDQALSSQTSPNPALPDISDIILSHWHGDHIGGLPSVLTLLQSRWQSRNPTVSSTEYPAPKLHKYPIPPNDTSYASSTHNHLPEVIKSLPIGSFTPNPNGSPFHDLSDGQLFLPSSNNNTPQIRVLHTPGHTIDAISLEIIPDRALYTSDTVLGQGTSVFEDLALYLQSLQKMLKHGEEQEASVKYQVLYPGHGPVVKNGRELISTYIKHRLEREQQILDALRKAPTDGDNWSTWTIVKSLYAAYPENLWVPAARSIELHLRKLEGEGVVVRLGGEGTETNWKLAARTPSPSL